MWFSFLCQRRHNRVTFPSIQQAGFTWRNQQGDASLQHITVQSTRTTMITFFFSLFDNKQQNCFHLFAYFCCSQHFLKKKHTHNINLRQTLNDRIWDWVKSYGFSPTIHKFMAMIGFHCNAIGRIYFPLRSSGVNSISSASEVVGTRVSVVILVELSNTTG